MSHEIDTRDIEEAVRRGVDDARAELRGLSEQMRKDHKSFGEALQKELLALDDTLGKRTAATIESLRAEVADIRNAAEEVIAAISEHASLTVERTTNDLAAAVKNERATHADHIEELKRVHSGQIQELTTLREAEKAAAVAAAKAETAQHDADRRIKEAVKREGEAERAVQIMVLRGQHEVTRAQAEVEAKMKRKATLAALDMEDEEQAARFDLEAEQIEKGINHFYPQMVARLEELAKDDENKKEQKGNE